MKYGKCLETRRRESGIVYRRYETEDGTCVTTFEVPATVLRGLAGGDRLDRLFAAWGAGQEKRALAAKRRRQVLSRPRSSASALSKELSITEARVRQIRAEAGGVPPERDAPGVALAQAWFSPAVPPTSSSSD